MALFDYQEAGVAWMLGREAGSTPGGFLCDEMGLGKTLQLIETIRRNRLKNTLIVVPKSIVGQWRKELDRFAPELDVHVFDGPTRVWRLASIVLVPYSVVADVPDDINWGRIILDEGHEIRNPKSKTYKTLRSLPADVRWIVSGTPVFNSMRDFVALCGFLGISPGTVARSTDEVRTKYVLRRTRNVTTATFENVELDMYPEERDLYIEAFMAGRETLKGGVTGMNSMVVLECLLRIRQTMIWPQLFLDGMATKNSTDPEPFMGRSKKHETLMEMVETHPDEKALVFTQFTSETDRIQELLVAKNIPVFRLDGHVGKEDREERITQFRAAGPNAVFLIQIKAGGVGLNLQEASRVYIMAPAWNPATELQAIGRADRTGQKRAVIVKKFIYKNASDEYPSVEQSIVDLQVTKSRVCADVLADEKLAVQIPGMCQMTLRTIAKMFHSVK
jgi:SNF2 family DNA or RNA helicase